MKNKSRVSILMTSYNGEKYVRQQIESINSQTYKNWELIIMDDCSKDKTVEIIRQFSDFSDKIKLIQQEKNLGLSKNFESGIKFCSGDYIAVCDVDDFWFAKKLETQVNFLDNHKDIGLVYHDLIITDNNMNILNKSFRKNLFKGIFNIIKINNSNDDLPSLLVANHVPATTIMCRTSILKEITPFPHQLPQDYWIAINFAILSKIYYIPQALVTYRQHETNMQGAKSRGFMFYLKKIFSKKEALKYVSQTQTFILALKQIKSRSLSNPRAQNLLLKKIICLESIIDIILADSIINFTKKFLFGFKNILGTKLYYHLIYYMYFTINKIPVSFE